MNAGGLAEPPVVVSVLGRPVVHVAGTPVRPVRRMATTLLGMLALRANRPLPHEAILDGLWPDRPPVSAAANVRSHLAELRRLLRAAGAAGAVEVTIEWVEGGYRLVCPPNAVDSQRFVGLVARGREQRVAGAETTAVRLLTEALALWRGPVLEGVPVPELVHPAAEFLADLRLTAVEELASARLALHQQREVLPELFELVAEYPLRESLWRQLLLALWADGRRAEAMAAYGRLVRLLDAELGVRPSAATAAVYGRIAADERR